MCRSSGAEIYDLAWSPDGSHFIIGSMDNIARIYNATSGMAFCSLAAVPRLAKFRLSDILISLQVTLSVRSRSIVTTFKVWHGIPMTNISPLSPPIGLFTSTP